MLLKQWIDPRRCGLGFVDVSFLAIQIVLSSMSIGPHVKPTGSRIYHLVFGHVAFLFDFQKRPSRLPCGASCFGEILSFGGSCDLTSAPSRFRPSSCEATHWVPRSKSIDYGKLIVVTQLLPDFWHRHFLWAMWAPWKTWHPVPNMKSWRLPIAGKDMSRIPFRLDVCSGASSGRPVKLLWGRWSTGKKVDNQTMR